MKEIEVKIVDINKEEVETKLKELGATKVFENEVWAHYFDFEDDRLHKNKQTVRLRKMGSKSFLTFKGTPTKNIVNSRDEFETEIKDFDIIKKILLSTGFKEWLVLHKNRTSYKLEESLVEIDTMLDKYNFIPTFLEIEAADADTIHKTAKQLGFSKEQCTTWGFSKLVKKYSP